MVFEPGLRVTDLLHDVVPEASIQLPEPTFTSTLLTATLSEAVPLTVIVEVVNVCPLDGEEIETVGALISGMAYVVFALAITLEQLNIGRTVIGLAVNIILASLGLGFALAIGLGCKDIVGKAVAEWVDKLKIKK